MLGRCGTHYVFGHLKSTKRKPFFDIETTGKNSEQKKNYNSMHRTI